MRSKTTATLLRNKAISWQMPFVNTAGLFLALTGFIKAASITGHAKLLKTNDPIFTFASVRAMLGLAAILEIVVALFCFLDVPIRTKRVALAWISTLLIGYRIGRWFLGVGEPCPCLGTLWEWLPVDPQVPERVLLILLVFLWCAACYYIISAKSES